MSGDWALLDTGKNFTIVSGDTEVDMEYGQFTLCLINTNFYDMIELMRGYIKSNSILMELQKSESCPKTLNPTDIERACYDLYQLTLDKLAHEHLSQLQGEHIVILLIMEIQDNLAKMPLQFNQPIKYIPQVFGNKELNKHIRKMLLGEESAFKSEIMDSLREIQIPVSSIIMHHDIACFSYSLNDTLACIIIDVHRYIEKGRRVKECNCCHRLFYPKFRSSELYCRLPNRNGLTCNEIMHRKGANKFAKARNNARGYQHNRINNESTQNRYINDFLQRLYNDWTKDCAQVYADCKSKDDMEKFNKWIEETKFTAKKLSEEWLNVKGDVKE